MFKSPIRPLTVWGLLIVLVGFGVVAKQPHSGKGGGASGHDDNHYPMARLAYECRAKQSNQTPYGTTWYIEIGVTHPQWGQFA